MADKYKSQRYSVYFYNPDTLEEIRKVAAAKRRTISEIITEACNSYLVSYAKSVARRQSDGK